MATERVSLKEAIQNKDKFSITWELVPGRGSREKTQEDVVELAKQAGQAGYKHARAALYND